MPLLTTGYDWAPLNTRRLEMAGKFLADNDELLGLIHANLRQAEFQHYNLEVYLAIAQLFRQNLTMLRSLAEINQALEAAERQAGEADPEAPWHRLTTLSILPGRFEASAMKHSKTLSTPGTRAGTRASRRPTAASSSTRLTTPRTICRLARWI